MDLYYVDLTLQQLFAEAIDEETGEMIMDADEFQRRYDKLTAEHDGILEGTALSIKNDNELIEAMNAEIKKLKARIAAKEKSNERKNQLLISGCKGENFETAKVAVKFRKSQRVIITDDAEFIKWATDTCNLDFITHKEVITDTPNKTAIKKWLNGGATCDYASVQEFTNVSIG